jgi:hypothetical protein
MFDINNSMSKFQNKFFNALLEQTDDRSAMLDTLDDNTNPEDFDVKDTSGLSTDDPNAAVVRALSDREQAMVGQLKEWVASMEDFLQRLNGTEDSIQTKLASAEADTLFDKMKQSEQRKIARVATELAALTESFKGFLAQSNNPSLKYV